MILYGKTLAKQHLQKVALLANSFQQKWQRPVELAVILVGQNPASQIYVQHKCHACQEAGIRSQVLSLPENISQEKLEDSILKLKEREETDAILVQLPLPKHLNLERVFHCLPLEKDVDGLSYIQRGLLTEGKALVQPCTPQGILHLLHHYKVPLKGRHALIVGRSVIVGKPMAQMLLEEDATVTICHSKTRDLHRHTRGADIVVVAAGKAGLLGKNDFHSKSIVIDVGIHRLKPSNKASNKENENENENEKKGENKGKEVETKTEIEKKGRTKEKLCGDVRFHEVKDFVQAITPVPGGVGPMTISSLLRNAVQLAEYRKGKKSK